MKQADAKKLVTKYGRIGTSLLDTIILYRAFNNNCAPTEDMLGKICTWHATAYAEFLSGSTPKQSLTGR